MPYKLRQFKCADCDTVIERHAPEGAVKRCLEHALKRMTGNMQQMFYRSGPAYDQYDAGVRDFLADNKRVAQAAEHYVRGMRNARAR